MDKIEFKQLVAGLRSAYQKPDFLSTSQDLDMWYADLKDLDYKLLSLIVQKWILTEKWPPRIADLRNGVAEVYKLEMPDWAEEWQHVITCMNKYGRMSPQEAYEELGNFTAEIIRSIGGWQMLCLSECLIAERANFRELYNSRLDRLVKEISLPEGLRLAIKEYVKSEGGLLGAARISSNY